MHQGCFSTYMNYWGDADPADVRVSLLKAVFLVKNLTSKFMGSSCVQGHEDFLEKAKLDEKGPWKTLKQPIAAVEYCRIKGLDYLIEQGTGKTNCKVSLEFNDPESQVYGKSFKLTLPELTDQPDFLVERNRYDASIQMGWRVRDHCKVWWAKEDDEGKGGSWWDGRIKLIRPTSSEFPDSPWESFHVTYKESSEPTPHSPWELFDKECKISGYNIPQIDPSLKESLLSIIRSMTDNSCREVYCPSFHLPHGWHPIIDLFGFLFQLDIWWWRPCYFYPFCCIFLTNNHLLNQTFCRLSLD